MLLHFQFNATPSFFTSFTALCNLFNANKHTREHLYIQYICGNWYDYHIIIFYTTNVAPFSSKKLNDKNCKKNEEKEGLLGNFFLRFYFVQLVSKFDKIYITFIRVFHARPLISVCHYHYCHCIYSMVQKMIIRRQRLCRWKRKFILPLIIAVRCNTLLICGDIHTGVNF